MDALADLLIKSLSQVWVTFTHNWPFLVVSVVIAVLMNLYMDPAKISAFLMRYKRAGVVGATAVAVTTPLCSCGTMAIILGMMANMMPWAPIVAFMVASPLTSPEELIYSAGLFGWPFAIAFFAASILLGLLGGLVAEFAERRGWLANQARMAPLAARPTTQAATSAPTLAASAATLATAGAATLAAAGAPTLATAGAATLATAGAPTLATASACACSGASAALEAPRPVLNNFRLKRQETMQRINAAASTASTGFTNTSPAFASSCCGSAGDLALAPTLPAAPACGCSASLPTPEPAAAPSACGCGSASSVTETPAPAKALPRVTWTLFLSKCFETGRRLLVMFLGFAFIGYFLNGLIPAAWISAVFGGGNVYSVPLAATLGLPLYINTEGSLPLVRALIDGGMSQGAALAFLITGAGTSIGAVAGALTIARWRVIALVISVLWVGAVLVGFLFDFIRLVGLV